MMVIGDVSKLKFSLMVDELDITKVSIGQKVKITSDAVENTEFEGEITNISMEGSASNGVTTYEATVIINNPGELKPSMNVDAVVVVESVENALRIPSSDIKTAMGISYVYVQSDGSTQDKKQEKKPDFKGDFDRDEMPQQRSDGNQGAKKSRNPEDIISRLPNAPEGFEIAVVEIGIQGDDYTEIISGLTEGQKIYKQETSSGSSNRMMGGFGGMGGGMPGGMGGGMGGMRAR